MELFFQDILALLQRLGPWVIFFVAASETAFFIGLLIPAEATVLVAGFLADQGYFELSHVLLATIAGGFVGDQLGYALGRFGGHRVAASGGRLGRLWRRHERAASALFQRRSILAVSVARFISFVRTLMPWFAGMGRMPYPRYVLFDLIGVTGWGVASVMAGYAAGRSWDVVAGAFGAVSAVLVAILLVVLYVWFRRQRRARLYRIALTGNIASGKSAVGRVWQRLGAQVIDADELAREAVAPETTGLAAVRAHFGDDVLHPDGELDRGALRRVVFADPAARRALEDIVHPEVERLRAAREQAAVEAGARVVVHMIPLLFEVGAEDQFDAVVLVDAPAEQRRARIVQDRGLSPAEAEAMIAAQEPAQEKREHATFVIDNDGTLAELERAAEETWQNLLKRAAGA